MIGGLALTRAEVVLRYISLKDAVQRYGTSKSTLYLLIKRGHIRAVKRGGRTLICVESTDQYSATKF